MSISILNRHTQAVLYTSDTATTAEAVSHAIEGRADLRGANLSRANLNGADLSWADLSWADLSWADLRGADLSEANLSWANLNGADLRWANLSEADLREANLSWANLSEADLREANLSWADLRGADLSEADLSRANCLTASGDLLRIAGSQHAIVAVDENNVSIGCLRESLAWWCEHYAAVGEREKYTPPQIEEYRLHLEYAGQWLAVRKQNKKLEQGQKENEGE